MTEFLVAVGAAVTAVLSYLYFARRRGMDALGPRPAGSFPDTFPAFAAAFLLWVIGGTFAATAVEGLVSRLLVITSVHVGIAVVLWPIVAGGGLVSRIRVPRRVLTGLLGGVVIFGFTLALTALIAWTYARLGHPIPQQPVVEILSQVEGLEWCIIAVCATAGAPLAEEIVYRGALLSALANRSPGPPPIGSPPRRPASGFPPLFRMSFTRANTIQAIVFGLMHVSSADTLVLAIPLALVGAALGWLYHRTGSLVTAIVAHAVFNALQFGFFAVNV